MALTTPPSLTPMQQFTLGFIIEFWEAEGRSPNYSEIQEEFEIKSKSNVARLVKCLTEKGCLRQRRPNVKYGLVPIAPAILPPEYNFTMTQAGHTALSQFQ